MAAITPAPWPRRPPCPDASAPGLPRPGPAPLVPSPARMCHTPPIEETPGPAPGSGGRQPAPGPRKRPGGVDAARPPYAGPLPDLWDGPESGPGPAPPDSAIWPVLERPGTTTC